MKRIWKILKILILSILGLVIVSSTVGYIMSEELPDGKQGQEADNLAQQILEKLNYNAFKKTKRIDWTFAGTHSYQWHKNEDYVIVTTNSSKVKLNLKDYNSSEITSPENYDEVEKQEIIQSAIKNFNNDSFWLIAPYKLMDEEVERRIVNYKSQDALLVTYTSGGTTPGDSYLWIVDKNYRPKFFKMWVSIIPIGGLSAKWKDWVNTQSGMILSTKKTVLGLPIEITNLETWL